MARRRCNPEELVLPYAGWDLVVPYEFEPQYIAAGFHEDGTSTPHAVAGDHKLDLVSQVQDYSGGWVLWENVGNLEYEIIDGSDSIVGYGD